MNSPIPIRDTTVEHQGFRSPPFRITGEWGEGVNPQLLGVKSTHDKALAIAERHAQRGHFREIVIA